MTPRPGCTRRSCVSPARNSPAAAASCGSPAPSWTTWPTRRQPHVPMDTADWDQLPDRLGLDPARESEWRDLARALRRAVEQELTEHQRRIFTALVVDGVPLDALVARLGTSRGAIYKTMFDARRKLRASLVANGYLDEAPERH